MFDKPHDDPERDRVVRRGVSFTTPVVELRNLMMYISYNIERASIYYKKEILKQDKPWTDNKILQSNKFTNVRRELDRESVWLINNVIKNTTLSVEERALNCFLFRIINSGRAMDILLGGPVLFDTFNEPADLSRFELFRHLAERDAAKSITMQSNAYFLSHTRAAANRSMRNLLPHWRDFINANPNGSQVYYTALNRETILKAFRADSPKESFEILTTISSIGAFLGYQIWVDWTYMPEYKFSENYFTVSGPGCDNGVDLFCKDRGGRNHTEFLYWMEDNLSALAEDNFLLWYPNDFFHFMPEGSRNWGVMQIENSFCEYAKLFKLKSGEKMRRRSYEGK